MKKNNIYTLWKKGMLTPLDECGVLKFTIYKYCKIYQEYLKVKKPEINIEVALKEVSDKLCVSERTVEKAIQKVRANKF